ncbi:MAG: TonB family protein, partial [Candidatus Goldiibacteriota bacterium]
SIVIHAAILLLLSYLVVQQVPRRVALITDVTLIDVNENQGKQGDVQKSVGVTPEQKKLATTLKKKIVKKTVRKKDTPDVKSLLKKIEEQKAKLDMGTNRENLRNLTDNGEPANNAVSEDTGAEPEEAEAVAGGAPTITGELSTRRYRAIDWKFPEKLPEETELMIEITVLQSGFIKNVKLVRTSGYPELDRMAFSQVRKMQFDPLPEGASDEEQAGVLLFKFGVKK